MAAYANPYKLPTSDTSGWRQLYQELGGSWDRYLQTLGEAGRLYLEENPTAGFGAYSTFRGMDQGSAFQNWLTRQYDRYRSQYDAMVAQAPGLQWTDFLEYANPLADYKLLATPYERGEYRSGFSLAPTMRMAW